MSFCRNAPAAQWAVSEIEFEDQIQMTIGEIGF
jgi:hypothetical protein